jgi:TPP-dependent indolepyruvate ferredoxin oxidoreductase alpha subunit
MKTTKLPMSHAIARALREVDVHIATHVPGHGATQTFDAFRELSGEDMPISFHEEPAYAIAHGAALLGMRSACIIKSHGLTKAMNAVMDSLSCGITAGMVNLIFEDKGGSHSDNIIDILPLIDGAEMPHATATAATIYRDVIDAYKKSEMLQLPYTLVIDSAEIDIETDVLPHPKHPLHDLPVPKRLLKNVPHKMSWYRRDVQRHVVCPIFAEYQRKVLKNKLHRPGFIEFVPRPAMPIIPEGLPAAYQEAVKPYLPLFEVFKTLPVDFVCGDAGVSTLSALPPYDIVHAALYMGGSIPTAIGAWLAMNSPAFPRRGQASPTMRGGGSCWSFIGDFSFISAGHYGLLEALTRKAPIKVLIFANGKAQTTGGQPLDLALLETLLAGYDRYIRRLGNPFDPTELRAILTEVNDSEELRIVVAKY